MRLPSPKAKASMPGLLRLLSEQFKGMIYLELVPDPTGSLAVVP